MSERDLEARLDAVERALTDDDTDLTDLRETADAVSEASDLEARVADLESRVDELEAGLQAVRGYAGNVRAVNREVERRASAALAKAEALEATVEEGSPAESTVPARAADGRGRDGGVGSTPDAGHSTGSRESPTGSTGPSADTGEAPAHSTTPEGASAGSGYGESRSATDEFRSSSGGDRFEGDPDPRDGRAPESDRRDAGRRQNRRAKSRAGDGGSGSDEPGPAEAESQTEQFIERVRDAL